MTERAFPVRIAVQLKPQHAQYAGIRAAVMELEDIGVDVIFNWDHFFPLSGPRDGLHFEAWTMLAAMAEQTERVQFGPLVNCNSYRNADLQADMARTIDHISARPGGTGRFIFGTGSGWAERDYDEYGYPFGTVGSRLDDLAEALPRIEARWAKLNPAPTRDIPVLIGGGGERKTLRLVARHADIWHSWSSPDTLERKLGVLDEWCAEEGTDPSAIEISVGGGSDLAAADRARELGASLFTLDTDGPDYDVSHLRPWLAWRDAANA